MKTAIVILTTLALSACTKDGPVQFKNSPAEFKDCRAARITASDGMALYVVKCPGATTVTNWQTTHLVGKTPTTENHAVVAM